MYQKHIEKNGALKLSYNNYLTFYKGKHPLTRDQYHKVKELFWKKAAKALVDNRGGLYLYGIGYFGIIRSYSPRVMNYKSKGRIIKGYNTHTGGYSFTLDRFDVKRSEVLSGWSFEPISMIKSSFRDRLFQQFKYEFRLLTVRNIYSTRKHGF